MGQSSDQENNESGSFADWFDLSGLIFKIARTDEEKQAAYACRAKGYSKYGPDTPEAWIDEYDEYAIQYICQDAETGEVLGCMRNVSSLDGPLEVEAFLSLPLWRSEGNPVGEYSRFAVPKTVRTRRNAIKLGMLTLAYRDALRRGHAFQTLWCIEAMRSLYDMLLYQPYPGEPNTFTHDALGGQEHTLMGVDMRGAAEVYRSTGHPLYEFMANMRHESILLDEE